MSTNLTFKEPSFEEASKLSKIYSLRKNRTCDSTILDTYIWKNLYKSRIYMEENAAIILMEDENGYFAAMPYCKEEDLPLYFGLLKEYFNETLHAPLKIHLADEEAMEKLSLFTDPEYEVTEETDLKDYLYSAEELRTLPGKRFQKKK